VIRVGTLIWLAIGRGLLELNGLRHRQLTGRITVRQWGTLHSPALRLYGRCAKTILPADRGLMYKAPTLI
jgi:hypothetical protein